jgi:uncharacterized protein (TIGR03437 family)
VLGPLPRKTGGNFLGEESCANSDCHGGAPNTGNGSVSISINGLPLNEYRYTPGETVPVAVTVSDPDRVRWGFQLTARTNDGCGQAGNFTTTGGPILIQEDSNAAAPCPPATLQFPSHSFPAEGSGSATFMLNWTAPSADIGAILFAAAGNAANGNNEKTGDNIYTTQGTVMPTESGGGTPPPSITGGGVVLSTGTPVVQQGAPGAIITVFGKDFAPEGTAALNPVLDEDGRVAAQLANTCLEVNGVRAPMFAVVPTQVNAQVAGSALGASSVVVIRDCGTANEKRSDPESLVLSEAAPAFFNFLNTLEGTNPIAATHVAGNIVRIGEPGLMPGADFTPAQPGEYISLFGTGFGPTQPAVPAGAIPLNVLPASNGQASVVGNASLTIGGIAVAPGDLLYVGVAPCCAGLYQVVAKVPANAPDGNLPVVLTINGVSSPQGPYITIRKQ